MPYGPPCGGYFVSSRSATGLVSFFQTFFNQAFIPPSPFSDRWLRRYSATRCHTVERWISQYFLHGMPGGYFSMKFCSARGCVSVFQIFLNLAFIAARLLVVSCFERTTHSREVPMAPSTTS
jgi:hypothetical protein